MTKEDRVLLERIARGLERLADQMTRGLDAKAADPNGPKGPRRYYGDEEPSHAKPA